MLNVNGLINVLLLFGIKELVVTNFEATRYKFSYALRAISITYNSEDCSYKVEVRDVEGCVVIEQTVHHINMLLHTLLDIFQHYDTECSIEFSQVEGTYQFYSV